MLGFFVCVDLIVKCMNTVIVMYGIILCSAPGWNMDLSAILNVGKLSQGSKVLWLQGMKVP